MVFASPNRTDNWIRRPTRPAFLALQDFTPVETLADDCLRCLLALGRLIHRLRRSAGARSDLPAPAVSKGRGFSPLPAASDSAGTSRAGEGRWSGAGA